ncbi:hypothetical protein B0T26DRAFT_633278 [Lasiosphaeria miniovina]|uniref:N-acetyltransferase domain-containing protein n=1 Tax=Lasiosphaeria miniovina TaxID=1954250 RepID=A0AA40BGB4_9PEZI|nr:uncharacterized protein B0T26DRAFT_633278 [Lasiosphaeria miniovina]KAK0733725.1 hypothetical protein B0T26DRAFT_633278 [Lasiosphaeria miniovina]
MSRTHQHSIRSFFQPRRPSELGAPPSSSLVAPPPKPNNEVMGSPTTPSPPLPPPPTSPRPNLAQYQHPASPKLPASLFPVSLEAAGVPVLPSPPSIPSQATIVPVAEQHISALRRINSLLLPVSYPDSFYAKALEPLASGLFSRAILWQDDNGAASEPKVIGGVICRLEPNPFFDESGQPQAPLPPSRQLPTQGAPSLNSPFHAIYIQSLALLSPYRSLGLAAAALEHIVTSATILPAAGLNIDVRTIYAHVWTENEDGLKWYQARRFAPEGREPLKGYYFKLRPDTAWVVRRDIGPGAQPLPQVAYSGSSLPSSGVQAPGGSYGSTVAEAVNLPPPVRPSAAVTPSSLSGSSFSFQNSRPDVEWNDLPADMVAAASASNGPGRSKFSPPSAPASGASSRSSSTARKKKERAYPSAAFGN